MEHLEDDLEEELMKLGFTNVAEIISTATEATGSPVQPLRAVVMDDLYSGPNQIGFTFLATKTGNDGHWTLQSIDASLQLTSAAKEEGVAVISKSYQRDDGPFPSKEVIREEVLEKAKRQEIKDSMDKPDRDSINKGLKK